jgi:hypothetical protein
MPSSDTPLIVTPQQFRQERDQLQDQYGCRIAVAVHRNRADYELKTMSIFIKTLKLWDAPMQAAALWERWFREEAGLSKDQAWPQLRGSARATPLSSGDWSKAWNTVRRLAAKGHKLKVAGNPGLPPIAFCIEHMSIDDDDWVPVTGHLRLDTPPPTIEVAS